MKKPLGNFKVVYVDSSDEVRATVVSYTEDGANDRADEMEDDGVEIVDVVECAVGIDCEKIARLYR